MDSYDLFGEDGGGMLEGLPDLGGGGGSGGGGGQPGGGGGGGAFDPAVTGGGAGRGAPYAQQQQHSQPTGYPQDSPLQKLSSFGSGGGPDFNHLDPAAVYAQGYGGGGGGAAAERPMGPPPGAAYQHQRQMVRPPTGAAAAAQYPYQTDNMYSMPDVQVSGMGDSNNMQAAAAAAGWSQHAAAAAAAGYPSMHRYTQQINQYRQQTMAGYPHQQEAKQQFPAGQHPMMQQPHQSAYQMQQRHAPHYPQPPSGYPTSAATQGYAGYMHQRLPHHHQYPQSHHQMDMSQTQQYAQMGHMGQTAHATAQSHVSAPQTQTPGSMGHPGYGQTHQTMQAMQRPMEVPPPPSQQQFQAKHSAGPMGNVSPQYRAPFPQLSPQMSPRQQMSPRPLTSSQMSPRPVMSPAKTNMSPHPPSIQQQTNLSPRPATSLTPKVTAASPAPMPPYSQQSTLQALEQMVMPPSTTNPTEYPPYQPRNSLGPPMGPQNPLSPAMGMRSSMAAEQQWPPVQPRQPSHLTSLNGGAMGMMEQNPIPTSQSIPPTQSLPPSSLANTQMSPAPSLTVGFGNDDLRSDIGKTSNTLPDMLSTREKETPTSQAVPVSSQSSFTSVPSPTTSLPDKMPSSTTNTEMMIPTSTASVSSHPPTPTPTSTTDDNITNNQEASLPSNSDSVKQMDELSNTSSTSQQQTPSQSSTTNNFTDFNCVSSMTGYTSQPSTPKTNKMDDLVQSNVSMFSQDNSVSQESLPESNKSEHSSAHSPRLQSPMSQNSMPLPPSMANNQRESRTSSYSINPSVSSPSPTQSHSMMSSNRQSPISLGHNVTPSQIPTSQMLPNISQHLSNIQQQNLQVSQQSNNANQQNLQLPSMGQQNQMSNSGRNSPISKSGMSTPPPATSIQNVISGMSSHSSVPRISSPRSMSSMMNLPGANAPGQLHFPNMVQNNMPAMHTQSQGTIPMANQNNPPASQNITPSIPSQMMSSMMSGPNNLPSMVGQNDAPARSAQSAHASLPGQHNVSGGPPSNPNIQSPPPQPNMPMMPGSQNIQAQRIQTPPMQLTPLGPLPHGQIQNQNLPSHGAMPPTSKPGGLFDQGNPMIGPNGMPVNTNRGITTHGLPMGHPALGLPGHPGMMGMMPGPDMPGYQTPISHHQERAALQQQLQEMYCMPPGPDHQEKITFLQDRLNILSQHEATDQCNGGPQCILQSPIFASPMIDSPQVTSTTGRGRGKGPPKPRKPRAKKGEKAASPIHMSPAMNVMNAMMPIGMQPPQQLPVSEDFVTPGAGLSIPSGEIADLGIDPITGSPEKKKKGRKPRAPSKTKEMRDPADPMEVKAPKERKKREPRDPKEPKAKRKYVRKKKPGESEESATEESFNKSTESMDELSASVLENKPSEEAEAETELEEAEAEAEAAVLPPEAQQDDPDSQAQPESSGTTEDEPLERPEEMQADSQTPAEGAALSEVAEDEPKKDEYNFEDQPSPEIEELPKRTRKPRNQKEKKVVPTKTRSRRSAGGGSGRRRRGTIIPESDPENEDMVSTPPPSPPDDGESSSKRRSARNTQRKKYIDDVMLRFSDDDTPVTPTRNRKTVVPTAPPIATPVRSESPPQLAPAADDTTSSSTDPKSQMNYVYVNTTEEDSMVVQYVLCSRMSRRKRSKEQILKDAAVEVKDEPKEEKDDDTSGDEEDVEKAKAEEKPKVEAEEGKEDEMVDVEEYYVKYRNFSYLHCEWKTEEELFKGDRRIGNKIKRFKQKQAQQLNIFENLEEEPFNPDYVEVDRVLDVSEHTDATTGEVVKHFLVKWRSLQYEDCTWELEEDVDPIKIQQYEKFNKVPPKDTWKPKKRPSPEHWTKLEKSPIYKGNNSLREYQLEGLNWLLFSWYNGRNCILADEMGLGKTIQSLTFLHAVWQTGIRGPFLVIAPLSTIPNWQREIESWTDMNVIVYHGSSTSRNMIQEYEMYYKNEKGAFIKDLTKFNIVITTFEIIVTDAADLKGFNWRVCVIDEAHRLKNRNCKLLEGLRQLSLEHRVLLSGTPLQNNVNELFSLLNFLEPTQFTNSEVFLQEFGALRTETEVQKLQCLLKPMMLRRLKEDVEKSLAPKEETVVEVELTNIQKKYYRGILERNFSFLTKGTTYSNIPNLMNTMMELRKCCIHPYLLNGAEEQIGYDYKHQHGEDPDAYYKSLINSSGKMVLIDKLLPKLKANGHRVLIFSQMVKCLDILEDYLMFRKYPFERIDGRIRGNLRQAAIDRFSKPDSDRFVFLLCTKAGGLGINLTAADTVIIYDSDWNPQNDLQAQARCHRIGQQKMVKIYRLLCRNTYEREMFDKASLKLGLDKAVLQSMNTAQGKDAGNRQLSKKEIEDLLKKGAYGALLDEEDGDKFCEEDIDVILARRTQVITMESEKGSTFSKASFASSANRSDIAVDDPDFWNKWAKKAEIDTTEKDESEDLVISEPRRRTQIKRYGHDESAIDMSELESSSDSDPDNEGLGGGLRSKNKKLRKRKYRPDDYIPREGEPRGDIVYGSWARRECFMVERGLLTFGWGRWQEILLHSQLRKGWKEQDIEDCARVILLFCLRFYRGDEKIRSFIWDLIAPCEDGGEQKISRNHHGLKDPVPRGIRNKHKKKDKGILSKDLRHPAITDPNHWSKSDRYDGDIFLESNYKKHLGRHANKVLLRVRMLYYIKHEIIGDLVQHIADGVHASALPIYPPVTEQLPCVWWDAECDRSLLIGTWKHGYENYTEMRVDPTLCFLSRCGPPSDREIQMATSIAQPPTPAPNEDEGEDDDTNEESSVKGKNRDASEGNSEIAEPSPGPSASSETQPMDSEERSLEESEDKIWPTITDLNTRLRRVITSYQRNYRKEEQKLAASKQKPVADGASALSSPLAALAHASQQFDPRDAAALGLQGWDLQQLALYLLKMERQGKQAMEQALREPPKERERPPISRRWTRREEADFFRVVSSYGVVYQRKRKSYDWTKFRRLARLDKKSDEELTEYYKHFVGMCRRQTGAAGGDEGGYDVSVEHVGEEKARRTLERLELLSRIREEVVGHPQLDERLRVCVTSADMPEWWVAGKHDKDLLLGVAKHGLGRTDYFLLNDPDLSFDEVLRKKVRADPTSDNQKDGGIKLESHEDILKFDKDEILVKLEKGEGTLKIEKVLKKETAEEKKEVEEEGKTEEPAEKAEAGDKDVPEEEAETEGEPVESEEKEVKKEEGEEEKAEEKVEAEEEAPKPVEKEEGVEQMEAESDLCSKQAAELKAMFPDLEVIQPLSRLSQVDTFVLRDKQHQQPTGSSATTTGSAGALDFSETTVAQLFNTAVQWPKEYAVQVRLQHIIYAVETREWPATRSFSAYATGIGGEFDVPIHELPGEPAKRDTSTPRSVGEADMMAMGMGDRYPSGGSKKRKRHIAIDVETERAKLHALLNSAHPATTTNPLGRPGGGGPSWAGDNDDSEESRRSTPGQTGAGGGPQPPPAHQQVARASVGAGGPKMPYDLQYHAGGAVKTIGQTTVIPGTSSTLTPIDLSSSIPKHSEKSSNMDIHNEAQDFSVRKTTTPSATTKAGNKLDDTLSKLMKRKNCPEPEQLVGKEKKRKKLDEIVLGLSAAKEQSLFPEPTKKPPVTPSVTVTPAAAAGVGGAPTAQKPFTITVTSVPSSSAAAASSRGGGGAAHLGKEFSSFLAQAEQQNLLLKKQHQQQQQRKSYDQMIADIGKVADYSSKVNSYSHEAKVNKWLAEQNAALAEQPLGAADYLSPRRRRPRVDPTLLDWKKLTGDENVAVVHRVTGKKLTGPKAPTLKRLGQWLMENPVYDIDPKWSELVKERGNLGHDLQKRVPGQPSSSGSSKSKSSMPSSGGRPPLLASPTGSTSSVSSANLVTSMPSSMSFPSLNTSTLAGLNSNLLSGLSGLGQFDPKANPLLMPYMGGLGSMGGLGNMNLFANLAGLGLPALEPDNKGNKGAPTKSGKPQEAHSSSSKAGANVPTSNPFPFFFPNPSLLYTPIGLGGLNPFALQPGGMSAAYDSLAQQCGLLNGGGMSPSAKTKTSSSSSAQARPSSSSSQGKAPRGGASSSREAAHFQQLLLPPDTQILESISKAAAGGSQQSKKEEKRRALENLRGMLPTDFSHPKDKRGAASTAAALPGLADFTRLLEAQAVGGGGKRTTHEQQMKEALEHLSRTNAELMAKAMAEEQSKYLKRPAEEELPAPAKRAREATPTPHVPTTPTPPAPTTPTPISGVGEQGEGVDIEALLPPSTVVKSGGVSPGKGAGRERSPGPLEGSVDEEQEAGEEKPDVAIPTPTDAAPTPTEATAKPDPEDGGDLPPKRGGAKRRGKRRSGDASAAALDPEAVVAKKNLRSSAGRSAAAAAARHRLEAECAQAQQRESDGGGAI